MSNGAGSIQAMITSLKNNKRERKKIKLFNGLVPAKHKKTKLYHKKISEKKLKQIIAKIDRDAAKDNQRQIIRLIIIFSVMILLLYFLIKYINSSANFARFL